MQIYKNYFNSYTKSLIILEIKNAKKKNGVQHSINRIKTTVYTHRYWQLNEKRIFQRQGKFCTLQDIFQPTVKNEYKDPNHFLNRIV